MRRPIALLGATALLSILPETPALAEGSIVVHDGLCSGFVPTADGGFDPGALLETQDTQIVQNGGWVKVTCHFDVPDNLVPAKGVKADGVECMIPGFGLTTDSRMSASPGGRAVGTCRKRLN